jgi:acyl carrier protein
METLSRVFEQVLGRSVQLYKEMTADDVEEWDSITHLLLILASDKEFGIRFESSEIANAANVGEFVELVAAKKRHQSGP